MISQYPMKVLFVCMGNICRSPAGEIIFQDLLEKHQQTGFIDCDSAGTIGYHQGKKPDSRMSETLKLRGYRVFGSARQISSQDLDRFDLILTMDHENYKNVNKLCKTPAQRQKIRRFTDFCSQSQYHEVPDPYYGGHEGFELVADLLEDGCQGLLTHLRQKGSL